MRKSTAGFYVLFANDEREGSCILAYKSFLKNVTIRIKWKGIKLYQLTINNHLLLQPTGSLDIG